MTDYDPSAQAPPQISTDAGAPSHSAASPDSPNNAFFGPNGLRAGWRVAIFLVLFYGTATLVSLGVSRLQHGSPRQLFSAFTPRAVLVGEISTFAVYLLVAWIMSRIEARRFADYGLGLRGAFGKTFWLGLVAGFASISLLLGALWMAGAYHRGAMEVHGAEAWKYAVLWGLVFLAVGFQEENTFRGYLLFTLTTGTGFWPAAIVMSALFGGVHLGNGVVENMMGAASAGGVGFFFCILIRKTGNLWAAIGFHAAWDWGETYFYGVPDSGMQGVGHLFNAQFAGSKWLTGGTVGPEGSWMCLALLALLCVAAGLIPGAKYPNPDAIPDPRRRRAEPRPSLFPEPAPESAREL